MKNTSAGKAPVLNPGDAPEGFVAVEQKSGLCKGCYFRFLACPITSCSQNSRADRKDMIFVLPTVTSVPATLLYPMGSMGEAV